MSDYASFITQPFWSSEYEAIFERLSAYYDYTPVPGDKGTVAFAGHFRAHSDKGLVDYFMALALDLYPLLPEGRDFHLTLLGETGNELVTSAKRAKASHDAWLEARRARESGYAAYGSLRRDDEQASGPNPDMDAFLAS